MKKKLQQTYIVMGALCLILLCSSLAMAAAPKPPANICLNNSSGSVFSIVVKPSSTIKMSDGTQKFYSIQGAVIASVNMPLVGAGYVEGTVFHFNFNGTYNISGTPYFFQMEGFWDLIAKTGTMYAYISATGNWVWTLSQVSCTDYDILYSQEAGGSPFVPSK